MRSAFACYAIDDFVYKINGCVTAIAVLRDCDRRLRACDRRLRACDRRFHSRFTGFSAIAQGKLVMFGEANLSLAHSNKSGRDPVEVNRRPRGNPLAAMSVSAL